MTTKKSTKKPEKKSLTPDVKVENGADKPVVAYTIMEDGAHAEERLAIQNNNREWNSKGEQSMPELKSQDGHAILIVDVPAHQKEVPLAHSTFDGCAIAAVQAWDAVKGSGDASFQNSVAGHRQNLLNHAEEIFRGGNPMVGDTILARFEREVSRIKGEQERARQEEAEMATPPQPDFKANASDSEIIVNKQGELQ